jgi:hypothetical protein
MTIKYSLHSKKFFSVLMCFIVLVCAPMARAEEDEVDSLAVVKALDMNADQEIMKKEIIQDRLNKKIDEVANDLKRAAIELKKSKMMDDNSPGPLDFMLSSLKSENVTSEFSVTQIDKKLKEIISASASGHKNVENVIGSGSTNPYSGTAIQADNYLWQRFDKLFCNPYSANATEECAAKKGSGAPATENFIDFFVSDKTWGDASVIDALVFARRFFVGNLDRSGMGTGIGDGKTFFAKQSTLAQANLKMGVLTDLASRRAPTSMSSETVLGVLLKILAPSGEISSLSYEDVCSQTQLTAMEAYACSFTNKPQDGAPRIISQASIDKIMQYDFMLSSDFYNNINSSAYSSKSVERVEAFLKAQQVAQDYRALRLLQMKTATTAMNIMNNRN